MPDGSPTSRSPTSATRPGGSRRSGAVQARWDGRSIETSAQEIPIVDLPFLRWREVEVHRVDLGVGYEPAAWPSGYVREELVLQTMRWNARRPMGLTGLPSEALQTSPNDRLAWLLNRGSIAGLGPAGTF